jgi:SulP family sulfate permease
MDAFRRDLVAGITAATLALPLSMAFAIASGVAPEQGLVTSILCGAIAALIGGSRVQISGPTGAFVVVTSTTLAEHGIGGLYVCTLMAGAFLCLMSLARMGALIRFIPYPVTRAFTMGIAVLILGTQIEPFFGLRPVATNGLAPDFVARVTHFVESAGEIHGVTVALACACVAIIALWPARFARVVPGAIVGLVAAVLAEQLLHLSRDHGVATIGTAFGTFSSTFPMPELPQFFWSRAPVLVQPALTIALLAAMQALMSASVTDGLTDRRHDSNRELLGQGLANLVGPFFGAIPSTGAVARSVASVRAGATTRSAALVHSGALLFILVVAGALLPRVPLAALAAVLVVSASRMVPWRDLVGVLRWPRADALVFAATFGLTVFTTVTLAVEVGVVLAALLVVKRLADTSTISAVDPSNETEGSQHSLVGREIPPGVVVFRVFGTLFFGAADRLEEELERIGQVPQVLILRLRTVLAIDATGLQALEDLRARLERQGKHLVLSAPHTQPLAAMQTSGFVERLGHENVQPNIAAALERAQAILAAQRAHGHTH